MIIRLGSSPSLGSEGIGNLRLNKVMDRAQSDVQERVTAQMLLARHFHRITSDSQLEKIRKT